MQRPVFAYPMEIWLINANLNASDGKGAKMSAGSHYVFFAQSQNDVIDPANLCGALDDGVEDRLHVRRRAADDAEHLGRCRLMLQGLTQFRVALLDLLEQSHVLDGDDGLVGKGFEKGDLLFGERTDLQTSNEDRSGGNASSEQGRGK